MSKTAPVTPVPEAVSVRTAPLYLRQFELYRGIACVSVVAQHAILWPVTGSSITGWALVMVLHATREVFFFLSAFLAYYTQLSRPRSTGQLWYRRLTQVIVPYLVWTAIYFAYTMIGPGGPTGHPLSTLVTDLTNGYYQLYFIVVLIQFYVLLPLLVWLVRISRRYHWWVLGVSAALQLAMTTVSHYVTTRNGTLAALHQLVVQLLQSRLISGYQLWLVAGLLAADHYEDVQRFVERHSKGILACVAAIGLGTEGYYFYGVAIGQSPGHASDLYQPVATLWFAAAIAGLYALGWRWASRSAARAPTRRDQLVVWGADVSGGLYLAHVLVLQLVLSGLGGLGLHAGARSWALVSVILFVTTVAGSTLFVSLVLRTPLRFVFSGPDRTAQRRKLAPFPRPWQPAARQAAPASQPA